MGAKFMPQLLAYELKQNCISVCQDLQQKHHRPTISIQKSLPQVEARLMNIIILQNLKNHISKTTQDTPHLKKCCCWVSQATKLKWMANDSAYSVLPLPYQEKYCPTCNSIILWPVQNTPDHTTYISHSHQHHSLPFQYRVVNTVLIESVTHTYLPANVCWVLCYQRKSSQNFMGSGEGLYWGWGWKMCHNGVNNVIIKNWIGLRHLAWLEALLSVQPGLVVGAVLLCW
jgi:hypothetical protein